MEATAQGDGSFVVHSDSGNDYVTTTTSCSCPHFKLRLKGRGSCKHMVYIKELGKIYVTAVETLINKSLLEFIKKNGATKHSDIVTIFGDKIDAELQQLVDRGEIIYNSRNDIYQPM